MLAFHGSVLPGIAGAAVILTICCFDDYFYNENNACDISVINYQYNTKAAKHEIQDNKVRSGNILNMFCGNGMTVGVKAALPRWKWE